ncbi:MAG: isoprenylcysteine carboxylmethyltransferase family protein [Opitutales bacterium]|nr:isoprenylcysteine carboxylmethyltransferase family protein [Opitutales bacterium]
MQTKTTASVLETLRIPISRIVAVLILLLAIATTPNGYESIHGEFMEITGFGLLIIAALGRIWCSIYISGRKDKVLCTDGPYSISRNPLYFFSFIGVLGFSLALQSLTILLLSSITYLLLYRHVIISEEVRLKELFGGQFEAYVKSTPRFFPSTGKYRFVEAQVIKPQIIEKSLKEVVWFLLTILGIEVLEAIHQSGHMILMHTPF